VLHRWSDEDALEAEEIKDIARCPIGHLAIFYYTIKAAITTQISKREICCQSGANVAMTGESPDGTY
jgi:hypothetical protein